LNLCLTILDHMGDSSLPLVAQNDILPSGYDRLSVTSAARNLRRTIWTHVGYGRITLVDITTFQN